MNTATHLLVNRRYARSTASRRSRRWPYRLVDLGQGMIVNDIRIHVPSTRIADHGVRGVVRGPAFFAVAWVFSAGGFEPYRSEGTWKGT